MAKERIFNLHTILISLGIPTLTTITYAVVTRYIHYQECMNNCIIYFNDNGVTFFNTAYTLILVIITLPHFKLKYQKQVIHWSEPRFLMKF